MVRSPGFGSTQQHLFALFRLAFTAPPPNGLGYALLSNSLDRSTKSTRSRNKSAPSPCTHTISGSISLPFRGSFNLSLTVLVHYRSQNIFSLGTWSSRIQSEFLVFRPTRHTSLFWINSKHTPTNIRFTTLSIPGFHRLWHSFPTISARIVNFWPYAGWW